MIQAAQNLCLVHCAARCSCVESIGRCELCGLVDHHLVQGACPHCCEQYHIELAADAAAKEE